MLPTLGEKFPAEKQAVAARSWVFGEYLLECTIGGKVDAMGNLTWCDEDAVSE
jgi:hypothetical protein